MVREIDERNRWCEAFASLLVEETKVGKADALFLAEQARVCSPSLPPSYAVKLALISPHFSSRRVVAGRWWGSRRGPHDFPGDEPYVGW
jgi:hypothetical protein